MKKPATLFAVFTLVCSILDAESPYQWILNAMSTKKSVRKEALDKLLKQNDPAYGPAIVDILFYMPRTARSEMVQVLEKITGHNAGNDYYGWVEYIGRRQDLKSPSGYVKFKATLLSQIDPGYKKILYTGAPLKIRPEEIVWGGVSIDGIPPIDQPRFVGAKEAVLQDNEEIFGIFLKGESRAYPLRYLSWHEMLNDRIGGEPVTLSF